MAEAMCDPEGVYRLPAPENGRTYRVAKLAELMHVSVTTIYSWSSRGGRRDLRTGRTRRLRILRVPKGHILPGDLAAFLHAVDGVHVEIGDQAEA